MQVRSTLARQGLGAALFALALLFIPLHATLGDTPDPRYLEADEQQILIESYVLLLVLPNREYGQLEIILQDENARIAELSLALAANAHFSLPEHDYDYRFNANTGQVDQALTEFVVAVGKQSGGWRKRLQRR